MKATLDSFDVYNMAMRDRGGATYVTRESITSSMDMNRKSVISTSNNTQVGIASTSQLSSSEASDALQEGGRGSLA